MDCGLCCGTAASAPTSRQAAESHGDVGDRGNDNASHVDANRNCAPRSSAKAATSALRNVARIEYSLNGGRINTDFIDNSAGVDSSDREVNIKILLGDVADQTAAN